MRGKQVSRLRSGAFLLTTKAPLTGDFRSLERDALLYRSDYNMGVNGFTLSYSGAPYWVRIGRLSRRALPGNVLITGAGLLTWIFDKIRRFEIGSTRLKEFLW